MGAVLATRASLAADLRALGVTEGATLLVHASLSRLGWVPGGEESVNAALREAVGPQGTIVMPAQSWQLCDPAYLNDPAVPREWWPQVRDSLPVYDPVTTPTRTMGRVAELFRTLPGTLRSDHPHRSFAASGPHAARIVDEHRLDAPVGEESPLRELYALDAQVLLLGVGYDKCTALHLAEARCEFPGKHDVRNGAALVRDGRRAWVEWTETWSADDDFEQVGEEFAHRTGRVRQGPVGAAAARLLPLRGVVDFAVDWFPRHRTAEVFGADPTAWD